MAKSKKFSRPRRQEGHCQICGAFCEAVCTGYSSRKYPFVDGRTYEEVCACCHWVSKTTYYDEEKDEWVYHDYYDQKLHRLEEMMNDGWDKAEATLSIKAVKAAIKRGLPLNKE